MSTSSKTISNVSVVCALALASASLLPACSDNTVPDMPDTGPTIDTGPQLDTGGARDTGARDTNSTLDTNVPDARGDLDAFVDIDTSFVTPDGGSDAGPTCGNGMLDTGETCDVAITTGAGACPTSCNDSVACTTDTMSGSMCTAACTHTPITMPSGTTMDMCCPTGATHTSDVDCPASCGNGMLDAGETCDTAITTGAGACPTIASCNDSMTCTTDALVSGGTCNAMCTHTAITAPSGMTVDMCCPPGANHNIDTDCAPMCGNSVIEGPGETCDPPAAGTCDAACHRIAACGDGALDAGEDCDDHNLRNLDGCDSTCHYESFVRLTELNISRTRAPMGCTPRTNQLGTALQTLTVNSLNGTLNTDVGNGTLDVLIQALGLNDLNGVADPSLMLGVVNGVPDPAAGAWPMAGNPIDWRFFIDHNSVATTGLPTAIMPAAIATRVLTAGPATVSIPINLGGSIAGLSLLSTHVFGTIATMTSHPPYPTTLRAGLTTFETIAGNTDGTNGLCGNVTAASFAQIPIPAQLANPPTPTGTPCREGYTYCGMGNPVGPGCNSLLDAIVNGCSLGPGGIISLIAATQPDVPGGTTLIPLTATGTLHKVTVPANDTDAYSSYFLFTANRTHASGQACTAAAQCQSGQACAAGVCM